MAPPKAPAIRTPAPKAPAVPPSIEIGPEAGGFSPPSTTRVPEFSQPTATAETSKVGSGQPPTEVKTADAQNLEALAGTTTATIPPDFEETILSVTAPAANPEGAHAALEDIAAGKPLEPALQKAMAGTSPVDRSGDKQKASTYAEGTDLSGVSQELSATSARTATETPTNTGQPTRTEPQAQATPVPEPQAAKLESVATTTDKPEAEFKDPLSEHNRTQLNLALRELAQNLAEDLSVENAARIMEIGIIRHPLSPAGVEFSLLALDEMQKAGLIPEARQPIVQQAINEFRNNMAGEHPLKEALVNAHVLTAEEIVQIQKNPSDETVLHKTAEKLAQAIAAGKETDANLLLSELTGGKVSEFHPYSLALASGLSQEQATRVAEEMDNLKEKDQQEIFLNLLKKSGYSLALLFFVLLQMGPGTIQQAESGPR